MPLRVAVGALGPGFGREPSGSCLASERSTDGAAQVVVSRAGEEVTRLRPDLRSDELNTVRL